DLAQVRTMHPMEAKLALAEQIVARYHGDKAAHQAQANFQQKFRERDFPVQPDAYVTLTPRHVTNPAAPAIGLVELVPRTGRVPSNSQARLLTVPGCLNSHAEQQTDPT